MVNSEAGFMGEPTVAATPTGTVAPGAIQSREETLAKLTQTAAKLLEDPIQMQRFTERVYELMQAHLLLQQERQGLYGGRR